MLGFRSLVTSRTPQFPLSRPQIPSNRDHKAFHKAALGGASFTHLAAEDDAKGHQAKEVLQEAQPEQDEERRLGLTERPSKHKDPTTFLVQRPKRHRDSRNQVCRILAFGWSFGPLFYLCIVSEGAESEPSNAATSHARPKIEVGY